MNTCRSEISQQCQDLAVTLQRTHAAKGRRSDLQPEMAPFARPGMPRVKMAIVKNLDRRLAKRLKALTDQGKGDSTILGHCAAYSGKTLRNGLTVTFCQTPAAT